MLASAAILASVVVRHNDILVRRDLRVRKKRVVGRHFAHRAPQCISSKTKVRRVLIHLLANQNNQNNQNNNMNMNDNDEDSPNEDDSDDGRVAVCGVAS
eukprot:COSAG04_NODE_15485_length_530_cov_2.951276_2_plen_98_part_01